DLRGDPLVPEILCEGLGGGYRGCKQYPLPVTCVVLVSLRDHGTGVGGFERFPELALLVVAPGPRNGSKVQAVDLKSLGFDVRSDLRGDPLVPEILCEGLGAGYRGCKQYPLPVTCVVLVSLRDHGTGAGGFERFPELALLVVAPGPGNGSKVQAVDLMSLGFDVHEEPVDDAPHDVLVEDDVFPDVSETEVVGAGHGRGESDGTGPLPASESLKDRLVRRSGCVVRLIDHHQVNTGDLGEPVGVDEGLHRSHDHIC